MPLSQQLAVALEDWVETFMYRAMHELLVFLKAQGLSLSQYAVFMRLYKEGPCVVSALAATAGISSPAASQMVDKLVKLDLLARIEAKHDRRFTQVVLTPKGRALTEQCIQTRYRWLTALPDLSAEQEQHIITGLTTLTTLIRTIEQEHYKETLYDGESNR